MAGLLTIPDAWVTFTESYLKALDALAPAPPAQAVPAPSTGPEQAYFRARLAQARGDLPAARDLVGQALEAVPGHRAFHEFARQIDAPLPERAAQVAAARQPHDA